MNAWSSCRERKGEGEGARSDQRVLQMVQQSCCRLENLSEVAAQVAVPSRFDPIRTPTNANSFTVANHARGVPSLTARGAKCRYNRAVHTGVDTKKKDKGSITPVASPNPAVRVSAHPSRRKAAATALPAQLAPSALPPRPSSPLPKSHSSPTSTCAKAPTHRRFLLGRRMPSRANQTRRSIRPLQSSRTAQRPVRAMKASVLGEWARV